MHTRRTVVAVVALCALFVSVWMLPDVAASEGAHEAASPLAEMTLGQSRVDWQLAGNYERLVLTITGPGNLFLREELPAGQMPSLSIFQRDGKPLPDGSYTYELRAIPLVDPTTREILEKAHARGDESVAEELRKSARLPARVLLDSGYLTIRGGSFTSLGEPRSASDSSVRSITAPYTFSEDLIVDGHTCIGDSCGSVDSFYPLKLNDELLGIFFDDVTGTSVRHDWAIVINSSLGSGEYFAILDKETTNNVPFRIEGDAPNHALYLRSNGNLGLGTSTPAQDIHAMGGNTPALRLEQDGSGGLTARTWDIGASHTELFVKDVTNSSSVPFRIKADAPSDTFVITSDGRVGIGTSSPTARLQVNANATGYAAAYVRHSSATGYPGIQYLDHNGSSALYFGLDNAASTTLLHSWNNHPIVVLTNSSERLRITSGGNIGIGTASPTHPLQMASGAHVTAGGVWTNASSRDLKHDIQSLEAEEARSTLARLEPVRFRYNADPADESLGFIAEDVPELVATVDHKTLSPMDLVAVLTRVVQEQQEAIGDLQATVTSLSEKLSAIEERKENGDEPR